MRIGINGTGIAGPALAYWLRRFGHEPVLFEQAPSLRTGGYVIDFWGLGYDLAERMGILGAVLERGYSMRRLKMVDGDGREVAGMDVESIRTSVGGRFTSIARAELATALFGACDGVETHFGRSIVDWVEDAARVTARLSDGREERFDLIVGADGLHSRIRTCAFGPEPRYERSLSCYVAAFRLSGYPRRDELTYVSHTVPKRQVARMALRGDETLVLFICRSELLEGESACDDAKTLLRRAFGGMRWEVPELLERMEAVEDVYFDRVSQIRLDSWTKGRVALVGDAGACVSFLAGEGTGLAIVEAYVLAGELHRAGDDWRRAFGQYETRLRAFVRGKQDGALHMRSFFVPETKLGVGIRDLLFKCAAVPFVARGLVTRAMRDELELPVYERG